MKKFVRVLKWVIGVPAGLFLIVFLVGVGVAIRRNLDPQWAAEQDREKVVSDSLLVISVAKQARKDSLATLAEARKVKLEKAAKVKEDSLRIADSLTVAREAKVNEDCFTAYVKAERALKSALKDPDSYQEIEHDCAGSEPGPTETMYVSVEIKYRAKNSFGGYVVKKRIFYFDRMLNLYKSDEVG